MNIWVMELTKILFLKMKIRMKLGILGIYGAKKFYGFYSFQPIRSIVVKLTSDWSKWFSFTLKMFFFSRRLPKHDFLKCAISKNYTHLERFQFRWLKIKWIYAAFPIPLMLIFNHLKWNSSWTRNQKLVIFDH